MLCAKRSRDAVLPAAGSAEIQAVQNLVAALGHERFDDTFLAECARLSDADQIAIFSVRGASTECLLAYRPEGGAQASALCRRYLREFIHKDSFLAAGLRSHAPFAAAAVSCRNIGDLTYRHLLFENAGLKGKVAALACGAAGHLYLNLYYGDLASQAFHRGLASMQLVGPLLLELLRKHRLFAGTGRSPAEARAFAASHLREQFHCLSSREAQVCAGILCGQSSVEIALWLGVSVSTVKTFRIRAYAKLAISSQRELFARCASLLAQQCHVG